ncbi:RNA polymerase sigma factor [Kordiimonas lipolytica]|uniref:RNA polymerase sigma factor n=1 Tax=Kordiimonas lipolytica TaxID=1662421 RepID=A0ABV8UBA6_9PROT|nr:sigma-70 family RNA polymerase sigma factor [Kordiimonas lipolytica]
MNIKAILQEHGNMLGRIVASYEADPSQQEELMQEVSLALWQALKKYRGDGSLKAYAARIAQNRCISHVARAVKAPRQTVLDDTVPSERAGPEEDVAKAQQRQALLSAVRGLPLPLKQVTTLALEGFSHREIAEALGISENNAMVRFSRAKAALKDSMQAAHGKAGR